jgi:hypothetical protein
MTTSRALSYLVIACLCIGGCKRDIGDQERLRRALQEEYGPDANWNVSFAPDSHHLLIMSKGAFFATLPDSLFAVEARQVIRFALSHYGSSRDLDSIDLDVGEPMSEKSGFAYFRVGRSLRLSAAEVRWPFRSK